MNKFIFATLSLILLMVSCLYSVKYIGVQDEELTDFTAATALRRNDFMFPSFSIIGRYVPLVATPYQGPWKSWLIAPFLIFFKNSVLFSRLVNIIFAMVYILSMYWAIVTLNRKYALLILLIPFWDSKFLFFAPFDFGPLLFQMIFIALSLGCIFRFINTKKTHWWYLGNLAIGAILAQKITSLPVFIVLASINTFLYFKYFIFRDFNIHRLGEIFFSLVLMLLPNLPYIIYFLRGGLVDMLGMTSSSEVINLHTYFPKLLAIVKNFIFSMSGNEWIESLTINHEILKSFRFFGVFSLIVIVFVFLIFFRRKSINFSWKIIYFALIFEFIVFSAIRGLNRPWHYFVLEPIWMLVYVLSLIEILKLFKGKTKIFIVILFVLIPILIVMYGNISLLNDIKKYKGAILASPITNDVTNELERVGAKKVFGLNFSVNVPIYFLSSGNIKGENLTWTSMNDKKLREYIEITRSEADTYIVGRYSNKYHWSEQWVSWLNRDDELGDFFRNFDKYKIKTTTISDSNGSDYFIIKGI